MPLLFIRTCNSDFDSRDDGAEYDNTESALTIGVQTAAVIAADEIAAGKTNVAVEVTIEQSDGVALLRSIVSISVSPILVADGNDRKYRPLVK